jgi:hypothetical protein
MRSYRFGMFLPQNWRFSLKIGSFVLQDAPTTRFGTEFAYSSAKTKNNGPGQKPGPQQKEVKL